MKDRTLREYLPILAVKDGCAISKRGDITFGWLIRLPVAYSVDEAGYDSILECFMQAYRLLPAWCVVHKQDVFRYDTYKSEPKTEFLASCYEKHFEGRKYLNGYSYLYLTFSSKQVIESGMGSSGALRSLTMRPPDKKTLATASSIASQFESILQANSLLMLERLNDDDFISVGPDGCDRGVLAEYLRLYRPVPSVDYPMEFYPDRMVSGDIEVKHWYIEDSDAYPGQVSSVVLKNDLSSVATSVFLSGGSPIGYSLDIPHVVNRYIVTMPRKSVEMELDQKKRVMNSFSLYSAGCRMNGAEIQSYLEQSAMSDVVTIKCFTDLMAWYPVGNCSSVRDKVVAAFSGMRMAVLEETRVQPHLYYAGIPGAAAELGSEFLMISELSAFLCHGLWEGYDNGMKGGRFKLSDRTRMVPVTLDTQSLAREQGYIDDLNMIVVGPTGTGKSFTMNTLVRNWYYAGEHIVIIDVGDSYKNLCTVMNEQTGGKDGVYNTYDPSHPFSFNPFRGRKHWGEVDAIGEVIDLGGEFVLGLIRTMYIPAGGWTSQANALIAGFMNLFLKLWDGADSSSLSDDLLEAHINARRARAEKTRRKFDEESVRIGWRNPFPEIFSSTDKDPVFDDFYKFVTLVVSPLVNDENFTIDGCRVRPDMFDMDSFGVALAKYSRKGEYGYLLNGEVDIDLFSSRLTVFEVDKIKDNQDLFPLWMLCIMHSFETKMRTLSCEKVLVIEEAWSAIARPEMAKFIEWLWRTARKFKTSAVVVTQLLEDLLASEIVKSVIVKNSSVKLLLEQERNSGDFSQSAKELALSDIDTSLALSVGKALNPDYKYKEAFLSIGKSYRNVYGVEVSLEEALLYESDKTKKRVLQERVEQCGSIIKAVKEIAEEIRSKKV